MNTGKKYKAYKRLTEIEKQLIKKMYEENIGQRAIARVLGVYVRTVQYHIRKLKCYKEMYKKLITSIGTKTTFIYFVIDELYTFVRRKDEKAYVWATIAVDDEDKRYYFYHLSKKKIMKH